MGVEVRREVPHLGEETTRLLARLGELPLHVQVILRALQHFADKAADGADVKIESDTIVPFFRASTRRSVFVFSKSNGGIGYSFLFRREKQGELWVKRAYIDCSSEQARTIVEKMKTLFTEAVVEGIININSEILEHFGVEVQQAQTA